MAEATDASPLLIGRILSQIRGPDGIAALRLEIKDFAERLKTIEAALTSTPSVTTQSFVSPESEVVPSPTLPEAPTTKSLGHPKLTYAQQIEWEKLRWTEIQEAEESVWELLPKWDFLITNPETGERSQDARQVVTFLGLSLIFIVVALVCLPRCQDRRVEPPSSPKFGVPFGGPDGVDLR